MYERKSLFIVFAASTPGKAVRPPQRLARNSLKTGFQESLSELSSGTTDGRCRKSWRHLSHETQGIERNFQEGGREAWNEGDKWQGRRLPHMVDKRRRIQLKLLG